MNNVSYVVLFAEVYFRYFGTLLYSNKVKNKIKH